MIIPQLHLLYFALQLLLSFSKPGLVPLLQKRQISLVQVLAAVRCSCPSCHFGSELLCPDTKAQTSGCLATRPQSRDHQAQACFTAGRHTDTITEMAKKTLRDTFAQAEQ